MYKSPGNVNRTSIRLFSSMINAKYYSVAELEHGRPHEGAAAAEHGGARGYRGKARQAAEQTDQEHSRQRQVSHGMWLDEWMIIIIIIIIQIVL